MKKKRGKEASAVAVISRAGKGATAAQRVNSAAAEW